jgi:50S ribosomal protein L16 3-hydroxylase
MPVAQFMRRYWQRRPLLVRQALDDFSLPLDARALFELAGDERVESRLVTSFAGWDLSHGPFSRRRIPPLAKRGWTLLVQGVDQHDDRAAELLARFRFVPDARLDDLMVSYASDGGGVGPHIDAYDVFLLQVAGRRRWRIGRGNARDLVPDLPLQVLRKFKPEREWVLEPGDMLYLPPGVAHEGTAVGGNCMTCSIGFRAPAWRELLEPWLETLVTRTPADERYGDPGSAPTRNPARLPDAFIEATVDELRRRRATRADARDVLLAFLTEPKPNVVFTRPQRVPSISALRDLACRKGLRLDRRTRMLYSGATMAINGELINDGGKHRALMHVLADARALAPEQLAAVDTRTWEQLTAWLRAGWLHLT